MEQKKSDPIDDAAFALLLHREWNAPLRRSRHERDHTTQQKADEKKRESAQVEEASSPSSSSEEHNGTGQRVVERENDHLREQPPKKREHGSKRPKKQTRKKRRVTPWARALHGKNIQPHEQAAIAALEKACLRTGRPPAVPSLVKCFVAGIPWGVLLPREVLRSFSSLAEAALHAFARDGFSCQHAHLSVVMVSSQMEVVNFPAQSSSSSGKSQRRAEGGGSESALWSEIAPRAVRLYLSEIEENL